LNKIKVQDCDIVFLSYDEPNAEKNYADLLTKVPYAKRVHGVEGSDAAHKACADLSETKHFVTVDGDTVIDPEFLNVVLDLDILGVNDDYQFSWCGNIDVNGLKYGNGSLKMWTKDFVANMKTHENTDGSDDTLIEFCYFDNYYQLNENFSTSIISSTPHQAWRAGFREGVKMSLNRGTKVEDLENDTWWQNYHRLLVWLNVGADVNNGLYTIMGARDGCQKILATDWDHSVTRDFKWLNEYWEKIKNKPVEQMIAEYGKVLQDLGLPISTTALDNEQSKFFKTVYSPPSRRFR
tara:strand:- start:20324 stop:21205 length:882 start_codon:yes stop_codon:yes gene_type:complete